MTGGSAAPGRPQAAEADLQTWLADQPGVVVGRHGGPVPEQWEGQADGHSFYFRERGGEWDIELDLHEQQPGLARGDLIATRTIAARGRSGAPGPSTASPKTQARKQNACGHYVFPVNTQ